MARFSAPYIVTTRKMRSGLKVWVYQARDPETKKRRSAISTGLAANGAFAVPKTDTYAYCEALRKTGQLIPGPREPKPVAEVRRSSRPPTLREWAAERHWWEWTDDGLECLYCKGELARSRDGAPAVQRDHADRCARILRDDILPELGDLRIDRVGPLDCEALMDGWLEEGASPKTINNRASVARVMFGEAERLEVIERSPWGKVKTYRLSDTKRGIVTMDEYRRLMHPAIMDTIWKGRRLYYAASLLASVTGMRQSEILGLRIDDLHPDHVTVVGKWNRRYGEGPQKTKRGTDELPIPRFVYDQVVAVAYGVGYAFSKDGKRPVEKPRLNKAVKEALAGIGIDEEERTRRGISFHSWRAFANTYFRARNVSDAKVRAITRHTTETMTEHYTPWRPEDFREVAKAQNALVKELE